MQEFQATLQSEFRLEGESVYPLDSMNKEQVWDQRFIDPTTFPPSENVKKAIAEGRFVDASLKEGYAQNAVKGAWNTATTLKSIVDGVRNLTITKPGEVFSFVTSLPGSMRFINASLDILGDDRIPRVVDERTRKLAIIVMTGYQKLINFIDENAEDSKFKFLLARLNSSPEILRTNLQKVIITLEDRIEKYTAQHSQEYIKSLDAISEERENAVKILYEIRNAYLDAESRRENIRNDALPKIKTLLRLQLTEDDIKNKLSALEKRASAMGEHAVVYRRDDSKIDSYLSSTPATEEARKIENELLTPIENLKAKTLGAVRHRQEILSRFDFTEKIQKLQIALYTLEVRAQLDGKLNDILEKTKQELKEPKLPDKLSLVSEVGAPAELTSGDDLDSLKRNIALLTHNLKNVFPRQIESVDQKLEIIQKTEKRLDQIVKQVEEGKVPIEFSGINTDLTDETVSANKTDILKLVESYRSKLDEEKKTYEKLKHDYTAQQNDYEQKLHQFENKEAIEIAKNNLMESTELLKKSQGQLSELNNQLERTGNGINQLRADIATTQDELQEKIEALDKPIAETEESKNMYQQTLVLVQQGVELQNTKQRLQDVVQQLALSTDENFFEKINNAQLKKDMGWTDEQALPWTQQALQQEVKSLGYRSQGVLGSWTAGMVGRTETRREALQKNILSRISELKSTLGPFQFPEDLSAYEAAEKEKIRAMESKIEDLRHDRKSALATMKQLNQNLDEKLLSQQKLTEQQADLKSQVKQLQTRVADFLKQEIKEIKTNIEKLEQSQDFPTIRTVNGKIAKQLDVGMEKLLPYQDLLDNEQFVLLATDLMACKQDQVRQLLNKEIESIEMQIKGFEKSDEIKKAHETIKNQIQALKEKFPNYKDGLEESDYKKLSAKLEQCETLLLNKRKELLSKEIKSIKIQIDGLKEEDGLVKLRENQQHLMEEIAKMNDTLLLHSPILGNESYSELLKQLDQVRKSLDRKVDELENSPALKRQELDEERNDFIQEAVTHLNNYVETSATRFNWTDFFSSLLAAVFNVPTEQMQRENYINNELIPALNNYKDNKENSLDNLQKTLETGSNSFKNEKLHSQLDDLKKLIVEHERAELELAAKQERSL